MPAADENSQHPSRPKWRVVRWLLIAIVALWAVPTVAVLIWVYFVRGHFD